MDHDLRIEKKNDVYMTIYSEPDIAMELSEYFTFEVPGARFTPQYRAKMWDGKLRLFNVFSKELYLGLLPYVYEFAKPRSYTIDNQCPDIGDDITEEDLLAFVGALNLHARGEKIEARDYQLLAAHHAIRTGRTLLLSPTASGKSLIIYILIRWFQKKGLKQLIIVPTTSLVDQLAGDFLDYSSEQKWSKAAHIAKIYSGKEKITDVPVVISTWQSIFKMPRAFFENFDVIYGDECLHAETLIKMGDGSQKKICDIQSGEEVVTFNETTRTCEKNIILRVHHNISKTEKMYEVLLDDGSSIKITGNHKVLLTSGDWKRVDELKIGGMYLFGYDPKGKKIVAITPIDYSGDVYNLHVENNHNYFANGITVSNCHLFKAKSLTGILNKSLNSKYRIGTTGTLDGTKTHRLVLEGLFGAVLNVTSTKKLIDAKQLAALNIKTLILTYSDEERKVVKKFDYAAEIDFLATHQKRNKFIRNLAIDLKGNTLILFRLVEKQGSVLYDMIQQRVVEGRKVFFVHGGTQTDDREAVRSIVERETDAIIVASIGVFSTGVNIRNLHNIIFASPSKSRVRTLQSIGRGLRTSEGKLSCDLYDIADDLSWKTSKNYTLIHMKDRIKIYNAEGFTYQLITVPLNG